MSEPGKRIGILVVSFNAADKLLKTLERIPAEVVDRVEEIVVFDDCSQDPSYAWAVAYKQQRGLDKLKVFRNPRNRGYGGNQKRGYQYALRRGFDFVVLLHGDGQYAPEKLPALLAPLEAGAADMVLGSRMMPGCRPREGGMPLYKYVGNHILTFSQNRITGMDLSEFHSGYRAYRCSALRALPLARNSDSWHFDTQILLQLHGHGFRIHEIPIPTFYGDEISRVNGIPYAIHCVWECVKFRLTRWAVWRSTLYDTTSPAYEFHDHPHSSHRRILDLLSVAPPLRVLDVGIAAGYLDRELQARGHRVTGIERKPELAEQARGFCDELLVGDIQTLELNRYAASFDRVLLADVLEHLSDPRPVLEKVVRTLKPGGRVIACVPNVANLYVRLNLLLGRFRYEPRGILDASHLRFFTLSTFRELIEEAGLEILSLRVTPLPLPLLFPRRARSRWFGWLYQGLYLLTRACKRLLAYQFIVEAAKPAWMEVPGSPASAGQHAGALPPVAEIIERH